MLQVESIRDVSTPLERQFPLGDNDASVDARESPLLLISLTDGCGSVRVLVLEAVHGLSVGSCSPGTKVCVASHARLGPLAATVEATTTGGSAAAPGSGPPTVLLPASDLVVLGGVVPELVAAWTKSRAAADQQRRERLTGGGGGVGGGTRGGGRKDPSQAPQFRPAETDRGYSAVGSHGAPAPVSLAELRTLPTPVAVAVKGRATDGAVKGVGAEPGVGLNKGPVGGTRDSKKDRAPKHDLKDKREKKPKAVLRECLVTVAGVLLAEVSAAAVDMAAPKASGGRQGAAVQLAVAAAVARGGGGGSSSGNGVSQEKRPSAITSRTEGTSLRLFFELAGDLNLAPDAKGGNVSGVSNGGGPMRTAVSLSDQLQVCGLLKKLCCLLLFVGSPLYRLCTDICCCRASFWQAARV